MSLSELYGPRQANLCLRAFRHDKFQLRMPSHSEGPGIWLSVWRFPLIHCLYVQAAKVLLRLRGCAGSPEPSLLAQAISTKFTWRGPYIDFKAWFKTLFKLLKLDSKHYLPIIKFRTSNHKLPVETGRWENVPLDERICQLYTKKKKKKKTDMGDDFHCLLCFKYFEPKRKRPLKSYILKIFIQDLNC